MAQPLPRHGPHRDVERIPGDRLPAPARGGPRPGRGRVQLPAPRAFCADEREYLLASPRCAPRPSTAPASWSPSRPRAPTAERQLGRMTFLRRTTRLMEAPLSVEERLQRLADLAVSDIADWCAVHLVRGNRVDQVAVAHSDPAKVAFVARLQERYPPDRNALGGAHRGEPHRVGRRSSPRSRTSCSSRPPSTTSTWRSSGPSGCARRWSCRCRARPEPRRVHARAGRVRAAVRRGRPRLRRAVGGHRGRRAGQRPALRGAVAHRAHAAGRAAADRPPDRARAAPGRPLPRPRPTTGPACIVGGDLYDVVAGDTPGTLGLGGGRRLRQGRGGRGAHRADPAHACARRSTTASGPPRCCTALNRAMLREPGGRPGRFATVAHGHAHRRRRTARPCGWRTPGTRRRWCSAAATSYAVAAPGTLLGVYPDVELTEVTFDLTRRDDGALHRRCDGGAGRERALRRRPAGDARGDGGRGPPTPSPTRCSPTSTRSSRAAARRHRDSWSLEATP